MSHKIKCIIKIKVATVAFYRNLLINDDCKKYMKVKIKLKVGV